MTFKRFLIKILYLNEHVYNLYKKDQYHYHTDIFKKKKYKYLLTDSNFKYDNNVFYYHIDETYKCNYSDRLIDNISINYSFIVNRPLNELLEFSKDSTYKKFLCQYFKNIHLVVEKSTNNNKDRILATLDNMFELRSTSLFDALQRILFINQLMWQTGHRLNVLGRLDYILNSTYQADNHTRLEKKELIKEFLKSLDKNYYYKSNALKGDTGQVIILGGLKPDGSYFSSELTSVFIECIEELQLPDPKILLRVANNTPKELFVSALKCIKTGCGSPLLSNDEIVIPSLQNIGYSKEDACNYATSACWEPLCDGFSLEQNNIDDLNFVKVLNKTIRNDFDSFEGLILKFESDIKFEISSIVKKLNKTKFAYDPLLSTFLGDCAIKGLDASQGGARYNNFGILTTGLGNSINALFNIEDLVFKKKKYSLKYLYDQMIKNYPDERLVDELKSNVMRYGKDNKTIIDLTNRIIAVCNNAFSQYNNQFGGVYRFGLSSPNYISNSIQTKASLDGRKDFEPFIVHISCDQECSYTELMNFASNLTYGLRNVNGNVVDLMVSPSFIDNNFDKFLRFIDISFKQGVFQSQFNVVDSKTLIEAKAHPDKFKHLIVRVWGFSAYFVELPENYQNLLIQRAITNEASNR